jgi:hypothetical protein
MESSAQAFKLRSLMAALIPKQPKACKACKTKMPYEHQDQFGRPLSLGQVVAFSTSYDRGCRVGTVITLTRLRVRVRYVYDWRDQAGELRTSQYLHLARPGETVILDAELPKHLTMLALRGRLG